MSIQKINNHSYLNQIELIFSNNHRIKIDRFADVLNLKEIEILEK